MALSGSTPATTGLASRHRTFFFIGCIDCDLRSSVCSIVMYLFMCLWPKVSVKQIVCKSVL